jgi:hypothetical protein
MAHVVVRDGRRGRDLSKVTDEGGEILAEFDARLTKSYAEGDRLTLPDGTEVVVIGFNETITDMDWNYTLFVGSPAERARRPVSDAAAQGVSAPT